MDEVQEINWREYLSDFYTKTSARYVIGQLEKCPTTQRLHIQFFANYKSGKTFNSIKKHDKTLHIEKPRSTVASHNYSFKEDTRVEGPHSIGEKPVSLNSKDDWQSVV